MTNSTNKPTTVFWIIGVIALLWNIMGVVAYLRQAYMSNEALLILPLDEQAYYNGVPPWVTAAFAIAVFSGLLGCIALLMKKKLASTLFILSLIAVITQFIYTLFIQDFVIISGIAEATMPIMVLVIAFFLVWYAKKAEKNDWIS